MGLDVTAYSGLSRVDNPDLDEYGDPVEWRTMWLAHPEKIDVTERNWPGRSKGIEPGAVYLFSEKVVFRAGSYMGYNSWRNSLAILAGYLDDTYVRERVSSGPFVELIHFSDCEGIIGPVVAEKLAEDFAEYQSKVDQAPDNHIDGFHRLYADFRRAFELARDNGAVDFH